MKTLHVPFTVLILAGPLLVLGGRGLIFETPVRGQSTGVSKSRPQPPEFDKPHSNRGQEPSTLADIGPAPPVALIDAQGKPFRLADLRGKAVIVSFIYTTCTGSCPATTFSLTRVRRALKEAGLWGKQVEFVSISLDPARDTPVILSGFARNYQADPAAWHFLTGPPDQVAKVIAAWGMWAKTGPSGTLDHPSRIFLVDPQGRQREIYNLEFLKPASVLHDVETVLAESAGRSPPRPLP